MQNKSTLSSVQNALRVLNSFTINETEKRVTQIAEELNIAKSTVSRLLKTLLVEGYVKKDSETLKYSLGTKVLTLYSSLMSNMEVVKEARPILEELAKETSESVQLAELEGSNVIYTEQIKSNYPLQIFVDIGRINPIHCTSSGKLLLAFQDEKLINQLLETKLIKYTEFTITDPSIIKKQLKDIRSLGYCISENEFIDGIIAICAPIKDYNNNVIAAISLVGPKQRIYGKKTVLYTKKVIDVANRISKNMGYSLNN